MRLLEKTLWVYKNVFFVNMCSKETLKEQDWIEMNMNIVFAWEQQHQDLLYLYNESYVKVG